VHGGPYPATNQPQSTAVGPYAIQRWCRPVCWQNAPESMLPDELRSDNPLGLWRRVNGQWTNGAV
jgi:NADP-dependent aldehyde dehydrogenase